MRTPQELPQRGPVSMWATTFQDKMNTNLLPIAGGGKYRLHARWSGILGNRLVQGHQRVYVLPDIVYSLISWTKRVVSLREKEIMVLVNNSLLQLTREKTNTNSGCLARVVSLCSPWSPRVTEWEDGKVHTWAPLCKLAMTKGGWKAGLFLHQLLYSIK